MSSDSDRFGGEFLDEPEAVVQGELAHSALGPLAGRVESVAEEFVTDQNLEKKTHFKNWGEPNLYARLHYLVAVIEAVGLSETPVLDPDGRPIFMERVVDEKGEHMVPVARGFRYPDPSEFLIRQDLRYRDSFREGTRKHLRDITKIFERGDGGRKGGLFRR